jgi:hypothetical protein
VRLPEYDQASRAAEFHHRALTEPYVSLSTHTAPSNLLLLLDYWSNLLTGRRWRGHLVEIRGVVLLIG